MAHKKGQGSSRNGRDSNPSYLGLKVADGQSILAGTIILKQRGTKFHPGLNVRRANDDSLFSVADGIVKFSKKSRNRHSGPTCALRYRWPGRSTALTTHQLILLAKLIWPACGLSLRLRFLERPRASLL